MKNDFLCFLSYASNEPKSVSAWYPGDYRVPILRTTHKTAPITFMNKKDLPRHPRYGRTIWLLPAEPGWQEGWGRHKWIQMPEEPEQRNRTAHVPYQPGGSCRDPASVFCWRSTVPGYNQSPHRSVPQSDRFPGHNSFPGLLRRWSQGSPRVGPEVLCHTKGGQSHQGYADPLDHKIKQGASQFYASGG